MTTKTEVDIWFEDGDNFDLEKMDTVLASLSESIFNSIKYDTQNKLLLSVINHYQDCIDKMDELNVMNDEKMQQVYVLGYLSAIIQTEYFGRNSKNSDLQWTNEIENNDNLRNLLTLLYKHSTVSKNEVLTHLEMKQSTMTNLYNKTKNLNLFYSKKYGRNVYYYITDSGREYYKAIISCKAINTNKETENVLYLLDKIYDEKNKENPKGKNIMEQLEASGISYSKPLTIEAKLNNILDGDSTSYTNVLKNNYDDYLVIK